MVSAFLKCPHCKRIQTKGKYCAFDGTQLKNIDELEEPHKENRDPADELNERFRKKIKLDNLESRNADVINSCKECIDDMLSQVELDMIKESFQKNDAFITNTLPGTSQIEAAHMQTP
jgi:DNA mismatch repair ATPase MutS